MVRRRTLRPDEQDLWEQVKRSARPIHPTGPLARPAPPKPSAPGAQEPKQGKTAIPPFALGAKAKPSRLEHDLAPPLSESLAGAPRTMDKRKFGQLRKGRLDPEGRIDLHGMTLAQAHPALIGFITSAHANGKRLVLVITGKGKMRDEGGPIPVRHGVLRHQVPQWLNAAPLRPMVMQISQAHQKHGGQGALYVYLRRNR